MKNPNFFIIGAPKCGTTSMASWLSDHPNIYMSPVKEPYHFTRENALDPELLAKYHKLFTGASAEHQAVGEASIWYLHMASLAVKSILEYSPDARFIVMLRNPVELAPSLHEQLVFTDYERTVDFEQAWILQSKRKQSTEKARWPWNPDRLLYGEACSLGSQLKYLFELVPRDRVHILLLDDVKQDAGNEYRRLLTFLDLDDDGRSSFPVLNSAKQPRNKRLSQVVKVASTAKARLGIYSTFGIADRLVAVNRLETPRPSVSPGMRDELRRYFSPEIELLQEIIGRDLSHWTS